MKIISLGNGRFAVVDAEDFERLSAFSWHLAAGRYAATWLPGRRKEYMHRMVLNTPTGLVSDHINRDTLDNRKVNLRTCSQRENCRNQRGSSRNSSGLKGVSWKTETSKWCAQIMVNRKGISLGAYATREEAAAAYDAAAREYFGEFAYLNYPREAA